MIIAIKRAITKVIQEDEALKNLNISTIDKIEGIDSKRPVFIFDIDLIHSSHVTKYYQEKRVQVTIEYFGLDNLDLLKMLEKLEALFVLDVSVLDKVLLIENKSISTSALNVLKYEFELSYTEEITGNKRSKANKLLDTEEINVMEIVDVKEV